jgi:hypothetical protein
MEDQNLRLTVQSREFLREIAKWAQFLSIVGFVGLAFIVLIALFAGSLVGTMASMSGEEMPGAMSGTFVTVLYLLMAVLYFFPIYYLFKFSTRLKEALVNEDEAILEDSLGYLKSHYKFIGILTIVMISIYILAFAFAIIGIAAMR